MNIRSLILMILALASCSVKEDRGKCPSLLYLDFSQVEKFDSVGVHFTGGNLDSTKMYHRKEYSSCEPLKIVASEVECMCFYGKDYFGTAEKFPIEEKCPEVWFHSQRISMDNSKPRCMVMLHKQYCRLNITLKYSGVSDWNEINVQVSSTSAGYLRDASVVEGNFCTEAIPDMDGKCSLNLPRQKISERLTLSIENGDAVKTFPLGRYLKEAGYDWMAASLEDVSIMIDIAKLSLALSTQSIDEICYQTYVII